MSGWRLTRRGLIAALAGGAALPSGARGQSREAAAFTHGVASGDPQADRVILWTRAFREDGAAAEVRWVVARNPELSDIVSEGRAETGPGRDYTVKVDAAGLAPGEAYFYGFFAGDIGSTVGRTRTLPRADAPHARLAAISCSNYPAGYFNVYRLLAERGDLDAVVHLGDYIYEYGPGGYATAWGMENGRAPEPAKEIVTLSDYRRRYAQYRSDPDLQAAHASHPFICVWDDHESTNDSWRGGAENHDAGEGAWDERKRAAVRCYLEWMPIRDPEPGRPREAIWRSFDFGRAASLVMLETRLTARAEQLSLSEDLAYPTVAFDVSGSAPRRVEAAAASGAAIERFPLLVERREGAWREIEDYAALKRLAARDRLPRNIKRKPDVTAFKAQADDPARQLLGAAQLDFVAGELERSRRAGVAWQALGNQVILARVRGPRYAEDLPWLYKWVMSRGDDAEANLAFLERSRFDLPMNLDAWDGYGAERARLYDAAREAGANLAALTGDTHAFWANDLIDDRGETRGIEFGTTSVSSPGMFTGYDAPFVDFSKMVTAAAEDVRHFNWEDRGCVIVDFTPESASGDYVRVSTIESREFSEEVYTRWGAAPGGKIAEL